MRRILLLIEDFNELIYIQTILKKIGFDVEGVSQSRKFEDLLLGFNPQSVIMTARGSKVNGVQIAPKIKRINGLPHVIFLKGSGTSLAPQELDESGVDLVVDTPVNVSKLVIGLSSLHGLEDAALLAKLSKFQSSQSADASKNRVGTKGVDPDDELISVKGSDIKDELIEVKGSPDSDSFYSDAVKSGPSIKATVNEEEAEARKERFAAFLKKMSPLKESHFSRDRILEFNKWIRSQSQPEDIDAIENERKLFVKKLFRK